MIEIKSNVGEVKARLERLREGVPEMLQRVLSPSKWMVALKGVSAVTLYGLARTAEERSLVPAFLDTMVSLLKGEGIAIAMEAPASKMAGVIGSSVKIAERVGPPGRPRLGIDLLEQATVEEARKAIEEWVNDPDGKRKTEEDLQLQSVQGKYANELVERMWWIFGIHPAAIGRSGVTEGMLEAVDSVMPHVTEFFNQRNPATMDPELVDRWLRRVLAAWRGFMEEELPRFIEAEMRRVMRGK